MVIKDVLHFDLQVLIEPEPTCKISVKNIANTMFSQGDWAYLLGGWEGEKRSQPSKGSVGSGLVLVAQNLLCFR
jgi:hypothetical protein